LLRTSNLKVGAAGVVGEYLPQEKLSYKKIKLCISLGRRKGDMPVGCSG
jgi:hypothetical protein